jgi:hypothetical protein
MLLGFLMGIAALNAILRRVVVVVGCGGLVESVSPVGC